MNILGVDPGPTCSGFVLLGPDGVVESGVKPNAAMLEYLQAVRPSDGMSLVVEWFESYGMPVGREVFETCRWIGRFQQAWNTPEAVVFVKRSEVKRGLSLGPRAGDSEVRRALLERFPHTGGGAEPAIGISRCKGPLYGVRTHAWPALAVAVVASGRAAEAGGTPLPAFLQETPLERIA